MKVNLKPVIMNNSSIEIAAQKLNYRKAQKNLKWNPNTNFIKGIVKTVEWYKNNYKYQSSSNSLKF